MRILVASVIAILSFGCASRAAAPGAVTVIPLLSPEESVARSFRTLRKVVSMSEGEALARVRLAEGAAKRKADAVANVRCAREVRIGFGCPLGVICYGEAVTFE